VTIAPMHYYGEKDKYDYANNKFGFDKGDLSHVRSVTSKPMGAGPYKFIKFENGVINYEANENYFKGAPKTKYVNFLETTADDDKLNGVVTGTIDITDPSFTNDTVEAIKSANGGELDGAKITTNTVDNLGYGYIGQNALNVKVGNDPASEASKNLRKAFGTIFAVYRDVAIDSYYGDRAAVINYPISNTSWAAPRPADDDYAVAFSKDVNGNPIYTSDMTAEQKYAAALEAALGYFEAAGYTVENGKLTAAPEGAKLEYTFWIPADGTGDHPAFMIVNESSKALATIGLNLIIKDLTNSSELWDNLDAIQVEMWAAAWGSTVDPDMYQIYYSDVANGPSTTKGQNPMGGPAQGGSNYEYCIADAELDRLIMEARSTTDQAARKAMYKACLDIVVDWAVETPTYQRQNAIIFSTERVNLDTVTPDITTFYGWMSEVENLEMK
jgi:peptide/nickel transport system substrate-binding protein